MHGSVVFKFWNSVFNAWASWPLRRSVFASSKATGAALTRGDTKRANTSAVRYILNGPE